MALSLRKLSSLFFKRPSKILKEINSNALMVEWLNNNRTQNIFNNRLELYAFINKSVIGGAIDYIEFGVYKGKSLFKWAELNKKKTSRFYGFDTFEGLPEPWDQIRHTDPKGHFDAAGSIPKSNDPRIQFVKGLFQDTLPGFLRKFKPINRLVVHNDSDLYSSTLYSLTQIDSLLCAGSVVIFDEFFCSSHEFQAFYDYTTSYRRAYSLLAATGDYPYIQVALQIE